MLRFLFLSAVLWLGGPFALAKGEPERFRVDVDSPLPAKEAAARLATGARGCLTNAAWRVEAGSEADGAEWVSVRFSRDRQPAEELMRVWLIAGATGSAASITYARSPTGNGQGYQWLAKNAQDWILGTAAGCSMGKFSRPPG